MTKLPLGKNEDVIRYRQAVFDFITSEISATFSEIKQHLEFIFKKEISPTTLSKILKDPLYTNISGKYTLTLSQAIRNQQNTLYHWVHEVVGHPTLPVVDKATILEEFFLAQAKELYDYLLSTDFKVETDRSHLMDMMIFSQDYYLKVLLFLKQYPDYKQFISKVNSYLDTDYPSVTNSIKEKFFEALQKYGIDRLDIESTPWYQSLYKNYSEITKVKLPSDKSDENSKASS